MTFCSVTECPEQFDAELAGLRCDGCGLEYCEEHAAETEYHLVKCVYCQDGPSTDDDLVREAMQR